MRKVNGVRDAAQLKDGTRDMRTCYASRRSDARSVTSWSIAAGMQDAVEKHGVHKAFRQVALVECAQAAIKFKVN